MVHIITDSTSDIPLSRREELGIEILPLRVRFGPESYADGVEITYGEFYSRLRASKELPVTGEVEPEAFRAAYEAAGGEDILVITLASQLSKTHHSATLAREELGLSNVHIVDSGTAAIGEASLVFLAVELREKGYTASQIKEQLEAVKGRVTLLIAIDNLTYLQKGGRLSATGARMAGILSIKPVVELKNGLLAITSRAKGYKSALSFIVEEAKRRGVDSLFPLAFAHSDCEGLCQEFATQALSELKGGSVFYQELGSVIGTHAGPGCVVFLFYEKG